MRRFAAVLAFLAGLLPAIAAAQAPPPPLPANSVWGRLGIGAGPSQAIPFATLAANLFTGGTGSTLLDSAFCSTPGQFIVRGDSTWGCRTITGDDLPNPALDSIGGVFALGDATNAVVVGLSSTGNLITAAASVGGAFVRCTQSAVGQWLSSTSTTQWGCSATPTLGNPGTTQGSFTLAHGAGLTGGTQVLPGAASGIAITLPPLTGTVLGSAGATTLTGGFPVTATNAGTKSSGTFTPAFTTNNVQYAVNGGAHTLAPPSSGNGSMIIQYTNNASAGTITTSGFTWVTGDALTTTNGDDFLLFITVVNGFSHLHVQALQ